MIELANNCSITSKRTLGYILDIVGIDAQELLKQVKGNINYSIMGTFLTPSGGYTLASISKTMNRLLTKDQLSLINRNNLNYPL